jgi:hypothetical protein
MSAASELRAEAIRLFDLVHRGRSSKEKPDHEALKVVTETASAWRSQGLLSYAGLAMAQAPDLAWGDGKLVRQLSRNAIEQLIEAANQKPVNNWGAIASIVMLNRGSLFVYADMDLAERLTIGRRLGTELAERLMTISACDYEDHILVTGLNIVTEFDGEWIPEFPSYEPSPGGMLYEPGRVTFGVRPAFRLMIDAGDYYAANQIAIRRPSAFITPSSLGWRAAVAGFVDASHASEHFEEAAGFFASDVHQEGRRLAIGEAWSSANVDLWAPYFRARADVARIERQPSDIGVLLNQAKRALDGTESGWSHSQVRCFRALVSALCELVSGDANTLVDINLDFERHTERFGADNDEQLVLEFIDASTRAFNQLSSDPAAALASGALAPALGILDRISLFSEAELSVLRPAISQQAVSQILGPFRTGIHRTLESITDERVLHSLVYRLCQARHPSYAQILHGRLEDGKDVVVLLEESDGLVLYMYQMKIGDIAKKGWRDARNQLEEAFDAPLNTIQITREPVRREAVLLFNGHLKPDVFSVANGWVERQRASGRSVTIMNLDATVQWIDESRLINEFRVAAAELGLPMFRVLPGVARNVATRTNRGETRSRRGFSASVCRALLVALRKVGG